MIENNIVAVRSAGDVECFICERPIARGTPSVQVTFRVTVIITKVSKTVEAHADPCTRELSGLLELRARQAQRVGGPL